MPGARCARSRACRVENTRVSHHGHTGNNPAFPAQWFYGFLRALPGDRLVDTVASGVASANLTPAPGCQDHTTSPSTSAPFVRVLKRPPHPVPHVRDDRETPLVRSGTEWL